MKKVETFRRKKNPKSYEYTKSKEFREHVARIRKELDRIERMQGRRSPRNHKR